MTTRSTSSGSVRGRARRRGGRWRRGSRAGSPSRARSPSSDSSSAVTWAPRWVRLSAAANPETPMPATTTRTPLPVARRGRGASSSVGHDAGDPLGVEDAEPGGHADARDDPEPDHDGDLLPAEQLEVVVQRRHPEQPFALGELEVADLQDHRQRLDHEQPAEQDEQELGAGQDREPGQRAAERERAGVAHEDLGRRGVPPQEAEAGAGDRGGDDGEVERVAHLVALRARRRGRTTGCSARCSRACRRRRPSSRRRRRGRRGRR